MSRFQAICLIPWKQKCNEGEFGRGTAVPGIGGSGKTRFTSTPQTVLFLDGKQGNVKEIRETHQVTGRGQIFLPGGI